MIDRYAVVDMNVGLFGWFIRDYPTYEEAKAARDRCVGAAIHVCYAGDYHILRYNGETWDLIE